MLLRFLQNVRWIVLVLSCLCTVIALCGCKKDRPKEPVEDVAVTKIIETTLKITNTGATDIKTLRINYNYDANSCTIKDLKSGQMVRQEIIVSYPTTLEFVIEYANGEVVKHAREEGFMAADRELQIVIEDNGKMYFR